MFGERYFYRLQKEYLYPVLHTNYVLQKEVVIEYLRGNKLYLSGDGRCDNPGYIVPSMVHILLWTLPLTLSYTTV